MEKPCWPCRHTVAGTASAKGRSCIGAHRQSGCAAWLMRFCGSARGRRRRRHTETTSPESHARTSRSVSSSDEISTPTGRIGMLPDRCEPPYRTARRPADGARDNVSNTEKPLNSTRASSSSLSASRGLMSAQFRATSAAPIGHTRSRSRARLPCPRQHECGSRPAHRDAPAHRQLQVRDPGSGRRPPKTRQQVRGSNGR